MADEFDALTQVWDEEGLFSRNIDGRLVRVEKATESEYDREVELSIDGRKVIVRKARPTLDSQGNMLYDESGRSIPRRTTIYDAAQELFVEKVGDVNPIPTLCHREHMTPVAVCRVCCVEVYREDREGKLSSGGKLIPACQHPVEPGMIVHTTASPEPDKSQRVHASVKVLTELLGGDHITDASSAPNNPNELVALHSRMNCEAKRFVIRENEQKKFGADNSSPLIAVNHDACILCERCMRGCNEIKKNNVIGRTGKGYLASIGFDLDDPMEESSCVSCGECMVSCPTDALTFRRPIKSEWHTELTTQKQNSAVTADELKQHALFSAIPFKWLQWNQASVVRRQLKKGDVLCWLGDFGSTAFILNKGEFAFWFRESSGRRTGKSAGGFFSRFTRSLRGRAKVAPVSEEKRRLPTTQPDAIGRPDDLIIGEMTCMSFYPRTATVAAWSDCEVFEIRRNVLYMLQRDANARRMLDQVYRERALQSQLRKLEFFSALNDQEIDECVAYLQDKIDLVRVGPGQSIFRQGEACNEFYIVRLGYVKVSQSFAGHEDVRAYLGPNNYFGEIGLISRMDLPEKFDIAGEFTGRRNANCTALDDVELVRIEDQDFLYLLRKYDRLRERFVQTSRERLAHDAMLTKKVGQPLDNFLSQGLFNGQKLLVLDLENCTRCDECVKACADTHGGVTRLVRDGLRFDKYLVASACRSCSDPYCMVGCPVDAIHRESSLEIKIDDHCIGCGLCAKNCPYGSINMIEFEETRDDPGGSGRAMAVIQNKASTCDLCYSVGVDAADPRDEVSCVYACPHNAAHRMSGTELFEHINKSAN